MSLRLPPKEVKIFPRRHIFSFAVGHPMRYGEHAQSERPSHTPAGVTATESGGPTLHSDSLSLHDSFLTINGHLPNPCSITAGYFPVFGGVKMQTPTWSVPLNAQLRHLWEHPPCHSVYWPVALHRRISKSDPPSLSQLSQTNVWFVAGCLHSASVKC